jgi:hypothetical protein
MERLVMMDTRETRQKLWNDLSDMSNRKAGIYLDSFHKPPTAGIKLRAMQAGP